MKVKGQSELLHYICRCGYIRRTVVGKSHFWWQRCHSTGRVSMGIPLRYDDNNEFLPKLERFAAHTHMETYAQLQRISHRTSSGSGPHRAQSSHRHCTRPCTAAHTATHAIRTGSDRTLHPTRDDSCILHPNNSHDHYNDHDMLMWNNRSPHVRVDRSSGRPNTFPHPNSCWDNMEYDNHRPSN